MQVRLFDHISMTGNPIETMTLDEAYEICRQELEDWDCSTAPWKVPQFVQYYQGSMSFWHYHQNVTNWAKHLVLKDALSLRQVMKDLPLQS